MRCDLQPTRETIRLWWAGRTVDKLQHEWPPCYDTGTTRQEISSNDVLKSKSFDCSAVAGTAYLEYTALATTLTAEHADLW